MTGEVPRSLDGSVSAPHLPVQILECVDAHLCGYAAKEGESPRWQSVPLVDTMPGSNQWQLRLSNPIEQSEQS